MTENNLCELNILLIDTADEFAEILAKASYQQNYRIKIAQSNDNILAILANSPFDILITDIAEKDSAAFSYQIRELYPDVSILIIFEASDMGTILEVLRLGSVEFLQKPLNLPELTLLLSEIAKKNCLQQRLKQSCYELEVEKEFLAVALRSIGDGVITTDLEGRVTMLNSMAEKLTGWSTEEASGHPVSEVFNIINVSSSDRVASPIDKVLATGETVYLSNHTTLVAKNGTEYQIADSAAPIRDEQHNILGMILVFSDETEQYRLRQEARAVQEQIQELFDGMQTMAAILNAEGEVVFANSGALQILGMELAGVVGIKLWQSDWFNYDADLIETIHDDYKQACAGNIVLHDAQVYTVEGLLWAEFSLHAVFADDGSVLSLVAEGRDVSERKRIEDENYSSLQHLKLYREQTPLAAIEWDIDLRVVDWNEAAERVFEYSLAEVKGRDWTEIMLSAGDQPLVKDIWRQIMAQTGGELVEQRVITKSGRCILVEWHSAALRDDTGTVLGGISLAIDITQEHEIQQALELQAKEQHDILNTLIDGVIMFGADARMLNYNKGAEILFGYSAEDALGMDLTLLRTELDRRRVSHYIKALVQGGSKVGFADTMEVVGQRKDKTTLKIQSWL